MREHSERRRASRRAAVAAALTAVLSLGWLAPPASAQNEEPAVSVTVTDVGPTTVAPDDTLTVTADVHNGGTEAIDSVSVSLSIVRYRLSTESILTNWFTGQETLVTPTVIDRVALDEPVEPGDTRRVTLSALGDDLMLLAYPEASGPRGLIVEVTDGAGRSVALTRTFMLWYPTGTVEPVRVSLLVPVTGPEPSPLEDTAWSTRIAAETADGGRLANLLAATAGSRAVTWVVDPALVSAAAGAGSAGAAWSRDLLAASVGREVFALAPFDPDVEALATAGVSPLLTELPDADAAVQGWRTDLTLPVDDGADEEVLAAAVQADRGVVVVRSGFEPTTGDGESSGSTVDAAQVLSGMTTVDTADGTATVLLPDAGLSALLMATTSAGSPFESRQLLLSRLAIAAQQDESGPLHVLLASTRGWDPDPDAVSQLLDGLEDAHFVELEPVSALIGSSEQDVSRTLATTSRSTGSVLDQDALVRLSDQVAAVRTLASVAADPEELARGYLEAAAAVTSAAWRADADGRRAQLRAVDELGEELLSGISVVAGSDVNLISESGDLPVTVRNDLPQEVTVGVRLEPDDRRLSAESTAEVTIGASSSAAVAVPVTAIGSGNVHVEVQILAADGTVVSQPSSFTVRVRADWETRGTGVLAGLLIVALTAGVVRTILRGRRATRLAPATPEQESP